MADTLSSKTKNLPVEAVQRAVAALAAGGMVVVVDDEDRENEGDLLIPAESVTAPRMTFLVAHTTGIVCAPMTCDRCEALRLPQMVADNTDAHGTAFTVSVDHVGAGTGVSSAARAKTIHALADPATAPSELRRPGHVFPLRARDGGVLVQASTGVAPPVVGPPVTMASAIPGTRATAARTCSGWADLFGLVGEDFHRLR